MALGLCSFFLLSAPARAGVLPGASCFLVCSCQLCPGRSPPARPPPAGPAHSEQGALEGRADPHPLLPELVPTPRPRHKHNLAAAPTNTHNGRALHGGQRSQRFLLLSCPGPRSQLPKQARGGGRRLSGEGSGRRAEPGQGAGVQAVPHHSQVLSAQQSRRLLLPALGATGFRALAPLLVTGQHSAVYT